MRISDWSSDVFSSDLLVPPNGQFMHVSCGQDRQCMCGPKGDADGTEWRFVQTFARATLAMSCAAHSSECRPGVTCHRVCRPCLGLLMPLRIGVACWLTWNGFVELESSETFEI